MKRHARSRFMPDAYVFAGGSLDAADAGECMYGLCANLRDARASEILGVPRDGLQFFVAAVRECFEECGILFAYDCENRLIGAGARQVHQLQHMRAELHACRLDLGALCAAQGWHLAVDQLIYFSHWITPIERPRRFDTRFFVAAAPVGQEGSLAGEEMSDLVWLSAARALEEHAAERLQLRLPTRTILEETRAVREPLRLDRICAKAPGNCADLAAVAVMGRPEIGLTSTDSSFNFSNYIQIWASGRRLNHRLPARRTLRLHG